MAGSIAGVTTYAKTLAFEITLALSPAIAMPAKNS